SRRRGGKAQPPETVDHDRAATGPAELALELAARRVIDVDPPVAEVADEDVSAEGAEARRRQRDCPGGVEPAAADQPLEQVAVRGEFVDESVAGRAASSSLPGPCLAKVTNSLPPMLWIPKGANPAGTVGSVKLLTRSKWLSK